MERIIKEAAAEATKISLKLGQAIADASVAVQSNVISFGNEFEGNGGNEPCQIAAKLASKFDQEKLEGLRQVLALMSKGSIYNLYPSVVMTVASNSYQIKKLVYIILIKYAQQEPDTALLAINTLQKDLNDQNALIRAHTLRVLSCIRVPVIVPLIQLSIKKCLSDSSPLVRRSCGNAIIQCFELDPLKKISLVEMIEIFLKDTSPIVVGSAISAFKTVCPDRFDLLHSHYYTLADVLPESDDWSCIEIMECLLVYCRTHFMNPCHVVVLDKDYLYLLKKVVYCLSRRNSAVVVSAIRFLFYTLHVSVSLIANEKSDDMNVEMKAMREATMNTCIQAITRCISLAKENELQLLLPIAHSLTLVYPQSIGHYRHLFYIFGNDSLQIKSLKLDILACLLEFQGVISQLVLYTRDQEVEFAVKVISILVKTPNEFITQVLNHLTTLLGHSNDTISSQSMICICGLLEKSVDLIPKLLPLLLYSLPKASSDAKEYIYWMYGEYLTSCADFMKWAPDILRMAILAFEHESCSVKLQILNLALKIRIHIPSTPITESLFEYLAQLAKFDENYDVRDKIRFINALIKGYHLHLSGIICSKKGMKLNILKLKRNTKKNEFTMGSLSDLIGKCVVGYQPLPDFPSIQPSILRKNSVNVSGSTVTAPNTLMNNVPVPVPVHVKGMNLNEFLASSSEECSEDDDEEESNEEYETDDETDDDKEEEKEEEVKII